MPMAFDVKRSANHRPEFSGGVQRIPMIATMPREKRIAMRRIDLIMLVLSFELWVVRDCFAGTFAGVLDVSPEWTAPESV